FDDQQHEFIPAEPRDGIAFPDASQEPFTGNLQEPIANIVPEAVIDQLEVVDVDEQYAERTLVAVCQRKGLLQPVLEQVAVSEPGESIVIRLVLELVLVVLDVRDVVLNTDEMCD